MTGLVCVAARPGAPGATTVAPMNPPTALSPKTIPMSSGLKPSSRSSRIGMRVKVMVPKKFETAVVDTIRRRY